MQFYAWTQRPEPVAKTRAYKGTLDELLGEVYAEAEAETQFEEPARVSILVEDGDDDRRDVQLDGKKRGEAHRGQNGEWYWVSLHEVAHAYPLDALDNVQGTGFGSPKQAIVAALNLRLD